MRKFRFLFIGLFLMAFINNVNSQVLVVGENSTALKSTDGGKTFTPFDASTPADYHFFDVLKDANGIWTVGYETKYQSHNARILYSNNGTSWTQTIKSNTDDMDNYVGGLTYIINFPGTESYTSTFTKRSDRNIVKISSIGAKWTKSNLMDGNTINDILSVSATDGYAVSSLNIWKTTNAGSGWSSIYSLPSFNDIAKFSDGKLIIVGNSGVAFISDVNSENWSSVDLSTTDNLRSIAISNDGVTGLIVGGSGKIWRTTNGGTNWSTVSSGSSKNFNAVAFAGNNTAIIGADNNNNLQMVLFKSTDGGATWTQIDYANIDLTNWAATQKPNVSAISFADADNGYIAFNRDYSDFSAAVLKTTNGGANWSVVTHPESNKKRANTIFAVDANTVFVNHENFVYKTTDGGTLWTKVLTSTSGDIKDIYFKDTNNGSAIAGNKIYTTTDGGNTWDEGIEIDNSGDNPTLYGLIEDWTVGNKGKVMKTTDNGANWEQISMYPYKTGNFMAVSADNSSNVVAAGENGFINLSTDGGNTWSYIGNTDYDSTIVRIKLFDANTICAISNSGTFIKTTDRGATWNYNSIANDLIVVNDMYMNDIDNAIVVGDAGEYYKTSNGGVSWTKINIGTSENLQAVDFGDASGNTTVAGIKQNTVELAQCAGEFEVDVTVENGPFEAENSFMVYLSDENGNFQNATAIGFEDATDNVTINCFIPYSTAKSDKYKIRVVAIENVITYGPESNTFSINNPNSNFVGPAETEYCHNADAEALTAEVSGGTFMSAPSGAITNNSIFNFTTTGSYTITHSVTDFGCISHTVKEVLIKENPDAAFNGLNTEYCTNADAQTMTPTTEGGTFTADGNIGAISGNNLTFSNAGTYNITYTIDVNGCTSTETKKITVKQTPDATFSGLVAEFCSGAEKILTVTTEGGTFTPATLGSIAENTLTFTNAGTYNVTYTVTEEGCSGVEMENITVKQSPAKPSITFDEAAGTLESSVEGASYKWLLNDNTTTLSDKTVSPTNVGNYQVVVTADNGCDSEISEIVSFTNSIKQLSKSALSIYPNPTNDMLNIKTSATISTITVYNLLGKKVKTVDNLQVQNYQMNLKSFGQGIYFLEINTNEGNAIQKVIVK